MTHSPVARGRRREWLILTCIAVLFGLVAFADRWYGLYKHPSNRYRFHAIPVALSVLYHGRTHDYTGFKEIAAAFHDRNNHVEPLMKRFADPAMPVGSETYYWSADDRGLADYAIVAFGLFGPKLSSLSTLYLLILGSTVALYLIGYRRDPTLWIVPVLVLFAQLFLIHAYQLRGRVKLVDGSFWLEDVALYESRVFEFLAALPWFHLALLATSKAGGNRASWLTAAPQAAIVLFLYHARSTIGWEYLALLVVAGGSVAWHLARRVFGSRPIPRSTARAAIVVVAVLLSLVALREYKHTVYNPAYFSDRGERTFWHNALIGFTYHPQLRERYRLAIDDEPVLHWVIREARDRGDPRFHPDWSTQTFIRSALGEETAFDWSAYEGVARDVYFRTWRESPAEVLKCYAVYKPLDAAGQVGQVMRFTATQHDLPGKWWFLGIGFTVVLLALGAMSRCEAWDDDGRRSLRTACLLSGTFLAFSVIPCIAFYASLATMSGVYLGLTAVIGCGGLFILPRDPIALLTGEHPIDLEGMFGLPPRIPPRLDAERCGLAVEVLDAPTTVLVGEFYRALWDGGLPPVLVALQKAELAVYRAYPKAFIDRPRGLGFKPTRPPVKVAGGNPPFAWAAFSLLGPGR